MKIEVLEKKLRGKDRVTGKHYDLEEGDRVTVSDACGAAWCAHGWVKDLSGEVETGERTIHPKRVSPKKLNLSTKATKVGGS